MRLNPHPKPIPNTLPPLEYVVRYLVKDPHGTDHLFWRDGRANHGHDFDGQAILKWKVKPTTKTHCVSSGVYSVVGLLLQHQKIDTNDVRNACGLPQCVNARHWVVAEKVARHRLYEGPGGWCTVDARAGHVVDVDVARLRVGDVVHVARLELPRAVVAMCGARIDPARAVIVEAPVTCKAGC